MKEAMARNHPSIKKKLTSSQPPPFRSRTLPPPRPPPSNHPVPGIRETNKAENRDRRTLSKRLGAAISKKKKINPKQ